MARNQGDNNWRLEKRCAKCDKEFYPYPEHIYRVGRRWYCSWTCFSHRNETNNATGRPTKRKAVEQYTLDGEFIREFKSANEAAEYIGCNPETVRNWCKGKANKSFIWKYKE